MNSDFFRNIHYCINFKIFTSVMEILVSLNFGSILISIIFLLRHISFLSLLLSPSSFPLLKITASMKCSCPIRAFKESSWTITANLLYQSELPWNLLSQSQRPWNLLSQSERPRIFLSNERFHGILLSNQSVYGIFLSNQSLHRIFSANQSVRESSCPIRDSLEYFCLIRLAENHFFKRFNIY